MFIRLNLAASSIAALVTLSACVATVDRPDPPIEPLAVNAMAVDATDTIDILISGGAPAGCPTPSAGHYSTSTTSYHLDFAAKTLHRSFTEACPKADGKQATTEKDVVLSDADRNGLLADAQSLVLETVTGCGADAPDQRITVKRPDGSSESHLVNFAPNTCEKGTLEIRFAEYDKLEAALGALLK